MFSFYEKLHNYIQMYPYSVNGPISKRDSVRNFEIERTVIANRSISDGKPEESFHVAFRTKLDLYAACK